MEQYIQLIFSFIFIYALDLYSATALWKTKPNLFFKLETNTNFAKLLIAYRDAAKASIVYSVTYLFQDLIITLIVIMGACSLVFGFSLDIFKVWIVFNILLHAIGTITNMIVITFQKEIQQ